MTSTCPALPVPNPVSHSASPGVTVTLVPLCSGHLLGLSRAVRELAQSPVAQRLWWADSGYTEADAARFLVTVKSQRARVQGETFAILDVHGEFAGLASAKTVDWVHGCYQAGYWLRPSAQGKGLATAALRALLRWGSSHGLLRAELQIAESNLASRAVAERCGARLEGVLHKRLLVAGARVNAVLYAIF